MFEQRFTPTNGPSTIILQIIEQQFDEHNPNWKKIRIELRDKWFGEFKVIPIMFTFKMQFYYSTMFVS